MIHRRHKQSPEARLRHAVEALASVVQMLEAADVARREIEGRCERAYENLCKVQEELRPPPPSPVEPETAIVIDPPTIDPPPPTVSDPPAVEPHPVVDTPPPPVDTAPSTDFAPADPAPPDGAATELVTEPEAATTPDADPKPKATRKAR